MMNYPIRFRIWVSAHRGWHAIRRTPQCWSYWPCSVIWGGLPDNFWEGGS
jgi:hypothetical protein